MATNKQHTTYPQYSVNEPPENALHVAGLVALLALIAPLYVAARVRQVFEEVVR